ncbi:uncharacterized protein [Nicotiana tomentosiformis]|uniref:uncharacterized protein n=1 Tax=Nicotiana tomentosiformis TaxID=4098 RepID=UPI00388CC19D
MKIVLHGKNKLGFVLGTYRWEMYDSSLHELWDKCNAIVLAWIMNTVTLSLISTVIYASDVHKVWEDLRERLRGLWDEYETLDPPPTCGCPESKRHTERYQLQKLYQFLTGLNESYETAKTRF